MICVIMAGGRGTRIAEINSAVPKPMIMISGKPILQWQIEALVSQNVKKIILAVGYLGNVIMDYFGAGERFGAEIKYIVEDSPLGTAGALGRLRGKIPGEDFLLVNGDILFDVDLERFYQYHKLKNKLVTIFTHPNDHPFDSGLIAADAEGTATRWFNKEEPRTWRQNRTNAGIHMCSAQMLDLPVFDHETRIDLDRQVLKPLIEKRLLAVYDSPEYVKDMGTPKRYHEVEKDIKSNMLHKKNLSHQQRAIFLDRDGTINKYVGFLKDIGQMELKDDAAEAIKRINQEGFLAIVITNQPVIARGELTYAELKEIHHKMETLLGEEGAYIDDLFFCPHHPDRGFSGEIAELKCDCDCRKPKTGLFVKAAEKYNINLSESWMIGDSDTDMLAGKNAGCKVAAIGKAVQVHADIHENTLLGAVDKILKID